MSHVPFCSSSSHFYAINVAPHVERCLSVRYKKRRSEVNESINDSWLSPFSKWVSVFQSLLVWDKFQSSNFHWAESTTFTSSFEPPSVFWRKFSGKFIHNIKSRDYWEWTSHLFNNFPHQQFSFSSIVAIFNINLYEFMINRDRINYEISQNTFSSVISSITASTGFATVLTFWVLKLTRFLNISKDFWL